jgi:hypothetical protein
MNLTYLPDGCNATTHVALWDELINDGVVLGFGSGYSSFGARTGERRQGTR